MDKKTTDGISKDKLDAAVAQAQAMAYHGMDHMGMMAAAGHPHPGSHPGHQHPMDPHHLASMAAAGLPPQPQGTPSPPTSGGGGYASPPPPNVTLPYGNPPQQQQQEQLHPQPNLKFENY